MSIQNYQLAYLQMPFAFERNGELGAIFLIPLMHAWACCSTANPSNRRCLVFPQQVLVVRLILLSFVA